MNYSFSDIIRRVESVNFSSLPKEVKLRRSGELLHQGSLSILARAEAALKASRQSEMK